MSAHNDGGPAFPQMDTETVGSNGEYQDRVYSYGGMTLRDWFAAHATDMDVDAHREYALHGEGTQIEVMLPTRSREQARYAYADAMLAARGAA